MSLIKLVYPKKAPSNSLLVLARTVPPNAWSVGRPPNEYTTGDDIGEISSFRCQC